jgi:hypothetical protein
MTWFGKIMIPFWVLLSGFNFLVFVSVSSSAKYFALIITGFCVWRVFVALKQDREFQETKKPDT